MAWSQAKSVAACISFPTLLAAGCIPLPAPNTPFGGARVITPEKTSFISDGVTTRKQVLLTLGEPDYWWDDQRVFAYEWSTTDVVLATILDAAPLRAFGNVLIKNNYLMLWFDNAGRIERHARLQSSFFHPTPLSELQAQWRASGVSE
jgi:hypothetical protein